MSIIYYQESPIVIGSSQCPLSFDNASLDSDPHKALKLLDVAKIAVISQIHGNHIIECTAAEIVSKTTEAVSNLGSADAIVISDIGATSKINERIAIGIRTADCLPIVIESSKQVALIHAGWRGLAAGIVEKAFASIRESQNYKVWIGPAAKKCCYEVGAEVLTALGVQSETEKLKIDLQNLARDRIAALNLNTKIEIDQRCTICSLELHSFRREQGTLRNFMFVVI